MRKRSHSFVINVFLNITAIVALANKPKPLNTFKSLLVSAFSGEKLLMTPLRNNFVCVLLQETVGPYQSFDLLLPLIINVVNNLFILSSSEA